MSTELVILPNHLVLYCPLLLLPSIFPSIRIFPVSQFITSSGQSSFSISPSNEYSGLISLGLTGLISLQSKGLSRVFSNTTVQRHQSFITQASLWSNSLYPYMNTEKTIALTRQTFVGKVMSLLFNMLSRFLIAFLPRSKYLLISWLHSPFAVILNVHTLISFLLNIGWINEGFMDVEEEDWEENFSLPLSYPHCPLTSQIMSA